MSRRFMVAVTSTRSREGRLHHEEVRCRAAGLCPRHRLWERFHAGSGRQGRHQHQRPATADAGVRPQGLRRGRGGVREPEQGHRPRATRGVHGPEDVLGEARGRAAGRRLLRLLHGPGGADRQETGRRPHRLRQGRPELRQPQAGAEGRLHGRRQGLRAADGQLHDGPALQPHQLHQGGPRPEQPAEDVGRGANRRQEAQGRGRHRIRRVQQEQPGRLALHHVDQVRRR